MTIKLMKNLIDTLDKINEIIRKVNQLDTTGGGSGSGNYIGLENAVYMIGSGEDTINGGETKSPNFVATRQNGFDPNSDLIIPASGIYVLEFIAYIQGTPLDAQVVTTKRFTLHKNNSEVLDTVESLASGQLYRQLTRPFIFDEGDIIRADFYLSENVYNDEILTNVPYSFQAEVYRIA